MALRQLKLGNKVKLSLIQPQIKCSGRDDVTCFYRGKVVEVNPNDWVIEIKRHSEIIRVKFDNKYGFCLTDEFEDLQIV